MVFHPRTSHIRFNKYVHKTDVSSTPLCPWGLRKETVKHQLQEYLEHCAPRKKYRPTEMALKHKLYGN